VPLIVGFARALQLAQEERAQRAAHALELRDHIIGEVLERVPDSRLTGSPTSRLPNHASFVFKDVDGNLLLMLLDAAGFACSSGSACKTGDPEPSDVLTAVGLRRRTWLARVTVGRDHARRRGRDPGGADRKTRLRAVTCEVPMSEAAKVVVAMSGGVDCPLQRPC
jgi:cysteine desulfurase